MVVVGNFGNFDDGRVVDDSGSDDVASRELAALGGADSGSGTGGVDSGAGVGSGAGWGGTDGDEDSGA